MNFLIEHSISSYAEFAERYDILAANPICKTALQTELRKVQREKKEYDTLRQNVYALIKRLEKSAYQYERQNEREYTI